MLSFRHRVLAECKTTHILSLSLSDAVSCCLFSASLYNYHYEGMGRKCFSVFPNLPPKLFSLLRQDFWGLDRDSRLMKKSNRRDTGRAWFINICKRTSPCLLKACSIITLKVRQDLGAWYVIGEFPKKWRKALFWGLPCSPCSPLPLPKATRTAHMTSPRPQKVS